jgi:autotransporter-associated beta strand protein
VAIQTAGSGAQTITNTTGNSVLTVSPSGTYANDVYAGLLTDNNPTGILGLVKAASGNLTLSNGGNSYSGGTTVAAGTLFVTNSTGSATGTGGVEIKSAATLAGNGFITGGVTVDNGGTIDPGISKQSGVTEVLTVNSLSLTTGSIVQVDVRNEGGALLDPNASKLAGKNSAYHDYVAVSNGSLNLNGATLDVNFANTATYTQGQDYVTLVHLSSPSATLTGQFSSLDVNGTLLVNGTGVANSFTWWTDAATGQSWTTKPTDPSAIEWWIQYNGEGGTVFAEGGSDVVMTNVPEPSTVVMMAGAAVMALGGFAWRRKQRSVKSRRRHRVYYV